MRLTTHYHNCFLNNKCSTLEGKKVYEFVVNGECNRGDCSVNGKRSGSTSQEPKHSHNYARIPYQKFTLVTKSSISNIRRESKLLHVSIFNGKFIREFLRLNQQRERGNFEP